MDFHLPEKDMGATSGIKPIFEVILEQSTPKAQDLNEPAPVWIKTHKPLLLEFLCFAKNLPNLLGLAANQLSHNGSRINERFFVFRSEKNVECELKLAVDPKIEETCGDPVEELEGCLTWPGRTILSKRYLKIRVSYFNIAGEKIERTLNRFESQVWQHEMDHLNGIEENLILDSSPYRREQPKVGRNDQCPCGSGKKFKKCCGV